MNKQQYREYFKKLQKYLKFTPIMERMEIPRTLFSSFINGDDSAMSICRLEKIRIELSRILKEDCFIEKKSNKDKE